MISSVDGQSGVTGLASQVTSGSATWPIYISKAGASAVIPTGSVTEVDSTNYPGLYALSLSSVDSDSLGAFMLRSRAQLTSPTVSPTLTTATAGGSLPATTAYYVVYTITTGSGETLISPQSTVTTGAGSTNSITVTSPTTVPNATGYNVYVGTTSGGPYYLQQQGYTTNTLFGTNFLVTVVSTAGANPPSINTAYITYEVNVEHQIVAYNPNDAIALGLSDLTNIETKVSTIPTDFVSSTDITNIASAILVTPANKLATNASGDVTVSNLPTDFVSSTDITNIVTAIQGFVVETGLTFEQSIRLIVAALAGQVSGASGSTITISAANNPATTRIVATVDSSGDRTSLTLTP